MKELNKDQMTRYLRQSAEGETAGHKADLEESSLEAYQAIWKQAEGLRKDYRPPSIDERWLELNQRKKLRFRNRVIVSWVSGIAASLLLFILFSGIYKKEEVPTILSATVNPVMDQLLADGSTISIMANSEISYESNNNQRTLALTGGGFFEIAKDPTKPFVINTESFKVEVLGTSFYVKDGTWGPPMVVVKEGLVSVQNDKHSLKIAKGEAVILDESSGLYERLMVDHHNFLAWKTGKLNFDTAPIAEVVRILETNFQTRLAFDNTSQAMLTASFKDQDLDDILFLIHKTLGMKIQEIDE